MQSSSAIELTGFPSMLSLYRRAITRRGPFTKGHGIPNIAVKVSGVPIDRERLNKYREVCGFSDNGILPITYPHILAFPLHMEILVNKHFPYKAMGIVHLSNKITQLKPIKQSASLDIHTFLKDIETNDKGDVITIATEVSHGKDLVWTSESQFLKRSKQTKVKKGAPQQAEPLPEQIKRATFKAPINIGRIYGKVSGDLNPIHLFPASAKLFGFKRHIAHGMWAKAYCLSHLEQYIQATPVTVDVSFKTPIFLPNKVVFSYYPEGDNVSFYLKDSNNDKPHITGSITKG